MRYYLEESHLRVAFSFWEGSDGNGSNKKVTPREMVAIEKALSVSLAMEQLKKRPTKHKAKRTKE